jgi:cyclopropane fatty-acyl-phospholipid synthase-like methyltransferase
LLLLARLGGIAKGYGFDVSSPAILAAAAAAQRGGFSELLSFEQRAAELGMPEWEATLVSAIDVLHHVPPENQRDFVHALCDALPERGGRVIIKDMVTRPRWRAAMNRTHDLILAREWVHHVDPTTVESWAGGRGFMVTHRSHHNALWYGHWLLVLDRTV